jgi:hypothetical protein
MTMSESRGLPSASEYYYRRRLVFRELLPAFGIAAGAAAAAFYVARLLLQRTPLERAASIPTLGARGVITRRPARRLDGD